MALLGAPLRRTRGKPCSPRSLSLWGESVDVRRRSRLCVARPPPSARLVSVRVRTSTRAVTCVYLCVGSARAQGGNLLPPFMARAGDVNNNTSRLYIFLHQELSWW